MKNISILILLFNLILLSNSIAEAPSISGCIPRRTSHFFQFDENLPDSSTFSGLISISRPDEKIIDVDLDVDISHTSNADLDIRLASPAGTIVTLSSDNGANLDNVYSAVKFDDQVSQSVIDAPYQNLTSIGSVFPEEPLSTFMFENPNGNWTIEIVDDTFANTGGILDGLLTITTCQTNLGFSSQQTFQNSTVQAIPDLSSMTSTLTVTDALSNICNMEVVTNIPHTFTADLDVTLTSPTGKEIVLFHDVGGGTDNVLTGTTWTDDSSETSASDFIFTNGQTALALPPMHSLSNFYGSDPNGTWTLKIADDVAGDTGTLNSWSLKFRSCSKDTDGDGTGDSFEACVSDPLKSTAGVCGCGVADTDSNSSGIIDCLTSNEIKKMISDAKTILSSIKPPLNSAEKTSMGLLKTKINEIVAYAKNTSPTVKFKASANRSKLGASLKASFASFKSSPSTTSKKNLLAALNTYNRAVLAN